MTVKVGCQSNFCLAIHSSLFFFSLVFSVLGNFDVVSNPNSKKPDVCATNGDPLAEGSAECRRKGSSDSYANHRPRRYIRRAMEGLH